MKVIGFHYTSNSSDRKKHYTVILTDTGFRITHYGPRTGGNVLVPTTGTVRAETFSKSASSTFAMLEDAFVKRGEKTEYDALYMNFTGIQVSDHAVMDDDAARKISREFVLGLVGTGTAFRRGQSPHIPNTLRNYSLSIKQFVENSGAGAPVSTVKRAKGTASRAAQKPEPRFTNVEPRILRPNGDVYKPRQIMGHTDVALLREFREKNIYARLAGPPGAGKTALAEAAFGSDLITINGHGDFTVANFVGSYLPRRNRQDHESEWEWHDGPLVRAMREGKPILVDEGTRIPAEALNILFSTMDGRRMLKIDDRPDLPTVIAEKGFYVIMGYNPDTLGARPLDEALISRFRVQITVKTDYDTAASLGVPALAVRIARKMETMDAADRAQGGPGYWVPQMRELLGYKELIDAKVGKEFALSTLVASCPKDIDKPALIKAIYDIDKTEVKEPTLGSLV